MVRNETWCQTQGRDIRCYVLPRIYCLKSSQALICLLRVRSLGSVGSNNDIGVWAGMAKPFSFLRDILAPLLLLVSGNSYGFAGNSETPYSPKFQEMFTKFH